MEDGCKGPEKYAGYNLTQAIAAGGFKTKFMLDGIDILYDICYLKHYINEHKAFNTLDFFVWK